MDEGTLERIVNVRGPLAFSLTDSDKGIKIETWRNGNQLTAEMIDNPRLRNVWYWTSNSSLTHLAGEDVEYVLGEIDTNLITGNPNEVITQLIERHNYFPLKSEIDLVLRSKNIVRIRASELGEQLQGGDTEWRYVEVRTEILAQGRESFKTAYGEKVTDLFDTVRGESIYGPNGLGAKLENNG